MAERNEATYFALGLAFFLLAVVLVLNQIEPAAVPVDKEQFKKVKDRDLILYLELYPEGADWQLKEAIRIRGQNDQDPTTRITLSGPDSLEIKAWRDQQGEIREGKASPWWKGFFFIAILIGVGLWHIWTQIQLDRKGKGSPRRRLRELEEELKQSKITEEEYRNRAEKLWAEL